MPILSSLYEGVPGRQAPLLKATGASRTAFAQSIAHLIDIGLLERNPGYGHPLRPEFRLTDTGKTAALIASKIPVISEKEDKVLLRRSWTLPILSSLQKPAHFNEIKRNLPSITDRALSQSLRSMEDRKWVKRDVIEEARPPKPIYQSINMGETISKFIAPEIYF
ncbi:winged helix-turn-helix transcriptional regulator [Emcibacteraceae bacterium Y4]|nr:winged helix-turn-helix transcriptional regulator [Pseudemcibacter aquimaris]MCC3861769.1 winged helix-turn-helix transcriptional regulator [Pseudemcibacter aquimaris]WDU58535.1 winged helix-turn-helix transcriptional regulator [Pseudemcibacter aquimaris]